MSLSPVQVIQVIDSLLKRAGVATAAIGGTIGFCVHGEGGGVWVVDLHKPGGVWTQPNPAQGIAHCTVSLYAEAESFAHLLVDPDQVGLAAKSGQLVIDGDTARLARLTDLLAQNKSLLQHRIQ